MIETLDSYIEAMYKASSIIIEEEPDFVVAPMSGSVPFIDVMHIVNNGFDASKVVYMPASSRIHNISEVIKEWYENFLDDIDNSETSLPKIVGIDEVVSGSSVVRCLKNIDIATNKKRHKKLGGLVDRLVLENKEIVLNTLDTIDNLTHSEHSYDIKKIINNLKNNVYKDSEDLKRIHFKYLIEITKDALSKLYGYRTIGIEDAKGKERRSKEYTNYKSRGRIIPVEVEKILSMDVPDFCPPRFEEYVSDRKGVNIKYGPYVKDFCVTPRYLEFLQEIARRVGKDPQTIDPINMSRIMQSRKYLSNSYAIKHYNK